MDDQSEVRLFLPAEDDQGPVGSLHLGPAAPRAMVKPLGRQAP